MKSCLLVGLLFVCLSCSFVSARHTKHHKVKESNAEDTSANDLTSEPQNNAWPNPGSISGFNVPDAFSSFPGIGDFAGMFGGTDGRDENDSNGKSAHKKSHHRSG